MQSSTTPSARGVEGSGRNPPGTSAGYEGTQIPRQPGETVEAPAARSVGSVVIALSVPPEDSAAVEQHLSAALAKTGGRGNCLGITTLARASAGATDVLAILQFDSEAEAQSWCNGPEASQALEAIRGYSDGPIEIRSGTGPRPHLTLPASNPPPPPAGGGPPKHKMAVVMWISVYPTITLLLWLLWPLLVPFAMPVRTLILSLVMVPLMVWWIVPQVTRLFGPWLRAGNR